MRVHRVTHPIIGVASWPEIRAAADAIRKTGKRICTWCHSEIPQGLRTRCGKAACGESIWQACSWGRCARIAMGAHSRCDCGSSAEEVDHVIPVSLGGTGDQWNLKPRCRSCHKKLTNRLRREKTRYVADSPLQPELPYQEEAAR